MADDRNKQRPLPFRTWGGKRKNAGRKPKGDRAGVSHARRPELRPEHPLHVTLRVRNDVAKLRNRTIWKLVRRVLEATGERFGVRIVEVSLQGNHLHLIVEVEREGSLSRGMQGFEIRLARALNKHLRRAGRVFGDRYHAVVLRTPTQVRNGLLYVLNNARKHAAEWKVPIPRGWVDPLSTAGWFQGWNTPVDEPPEARPTPAPRTWLLRVGWRRYGLLPVDAIPGARRASASG